MRWVGMLALVVCSGCATLTATHDVRRTPPPAYAGTVHLFRGGAGGMFSAGLDRWARQLDDIGGISSEVHSHLGWPSCCEDLGKPGCAGPIVLVGHSYGADAALHAARKLNETNVPVELLVTVDPVTPIAVPPNVRRVVNLYMTHAFWGHTPLWHGTPLAADGRSTIVENVQLRASAELNVPGLSHGTLDDHPVIQQEAIRHILRACKR